MLSYTLCCVLSLVVCGSLLLALAAGTALGYNYSISEFVVLMGNRTIVERKPDTYNLESPLQNLGQLETVAQAVFAPNASEMLANEILRTNAPFIRIPESGQNLLNMYPATPSSEPDSHKKRVHQSYQATTKITPKESVIYKITPKRLVSKMTTIPEVQRTSTLPVLRSLSYFLHSSTSHPLEVVPLPEKPLRPQLPIADYLDTMKKIEQYLQKAVKETLEEPPKMRSEVASPVNYRATKRVFQKFEEVDSEEDD